MAALAFWGAIVLPVLYLPLFVAGLTSLEKLALFLCLVALHALALFGGRGYNPVTG